MKKYIITAALALGLTVSGASAASAAVCVDEILSPIITLPIKVCVPDIDIPPIDVPPIDIPPIDIPPIDVPELPGTEEPSVPPVPGTPTTPAPPSTSEPTAPVLERPVEHPTPEERAISRLAERFFPVAVFLAFLAFLFGASRAFSYFQQRRNVKKIENSLTNDSDTP